MAGLAFSLLAALSGYAAVVFVVDPLGAFGGNSACEAGPKTFASQGALPIMLYRQAPKVAVTGTSRAKRGFDHEALTLFGENAANLGVEGAQVADFRALTQAALAGGKLETVYIGIDFSSLHDLRNRPPAPPISASHWPDAEYPRFALFSSHALRGVADAWPDCRVRVHRDGSLVDPSDGIEPSGQDIEAMSREFLARKAAIDRGGRDHFEARLDELAATIASLRARDVDVVLFSAPYRGLLVQQFAKAGLAGEFAWWQEEMRQFSRDQGVQYFDFHSPEGIASLSLPPCKGSGGIDCHYLDLTHYSPVVGRAIARELARGAETED
jgi:hypothetical protein